MAQLPNAKTSVLSVGQMEHCKHDVCDKSMVIGGKQRILSVDGHAIPLDTIHGLPHTKMRPHTNKEWEELPHLVMTSDEDWDPSVLDKKLMDDKEWHKAKDTGTTQHQRESNFTPTGNHKHQEVNSTCVTREFANWTTKPLRMHNVCDSME